MAENYLRDSESILTEAEAARTRELHHRAIRLSQESFELTLKAILRAVAVEYPKEHDVSDAVVEILDKLPDWFRSHATYLKEGSQWLSQRRGPSMYGDEIAGKPASQLFTAEDSRKALEYANQAHALAKRLLQEMFHST